MLFCLVRLHREVNEENRRHRMEFNFHSCGRPGSQCLIHDSVPVDFTMQRAAGFVDWWEDATYDAYRVNKRWAQALGTQRLTQQGQCALRSVSESVHGRCVAQWTPAV